MAGAEIAAILWPFIKAGAAVLVLWGIWKILSRLIAKSAVNEHVVEVQADAEEKRAETELEVREDRGRSRTRFRDRFLRSRNSGGGDSTP